MEDPTTKKVQLKPDIALEPMNLHDKVQFDELLRQRILSGWKNTPEVLETWREEIDQNIQSFFWIVPSSLFSVAAPGRYAGHIFMCGKTDDNGDLVQHIHSLFVVPELRSGGLASAAVKALEGWAKIEPYGRPDCRALTLNCIHHRYIDDDSSEEWRPFAIKVYAKLGLPMPEKGTGVQGWYERMGYVKQSEKPAYPTGEYQDDGSEILFIACDMRKDLVG